MVRELGRLARRAGRDFNRARWPLASPVGRLRVLLIAIAVIFSLCAGRALQIQAFDAEAYAAEAADQMKTSRPIQALRGTITDRFGDVLAYTEPTVMVIADPEMIRTNGKNDEARMTVADRTKAAQAPGLIADILARHLGGTAADYLPAITTPGSKYKIIAKKVSAATFSAMNDEFTAQKLIGVYRVSAPTRRYPNGTVASNVIGFVNEEGQAAAGLELALNKTLAGKDGKEVFDSSPNGRIPLGENVLIPAVNGANYTLTLDAGLQWQMEQLLANQVRLGGHVAGTAIAMDVRTGEVLGMANYPSFDSNDPGSGKTEDMGNRAITNAYEPGSVEKTLTFASMLDHGTISLDDRVKVPGSVKSGDYTIHDASQHGTIKYLARGVLTKSSNIGTVMLARKMPKATLQGYLRAFGLGQRTGIGLPGEGAGYLPGPNMPDYTRDSVAFGMGLSVTALQEAAAVAAIANGGVYNPPVLVKSTTTADGKTTQLTRGEPRRVVSEAAARGVADAMEQLVAYSTTGVFTVDGYRTAAKTGTPHRINPDRKNDPKAPNYKGLFTSTIGFGPVEDPHILVYVVIETMNEGGFGATFAAPVYADIMRIALPRYGVPPSLTKTVKKPLFW